MKKVLLLVLLLASTLFAQPVPAAPRAITVIKLPEPVLNGSISLEQAIKNRRNVQQFTAEPLKITQVGQLCWAAQGLTDPNMGLMSAPSAMGIYPMQLYVVLPDGLYLYEPKNHDLVKYINGDLRPGLFQAAFRQRMVQNSPCIFIISGSANKIEAKFRGRGERFLYLEAGHIAESIDLQTAALGLGAVPVGTFDPKTVAKICKFAEDLEPVYLICTGNLSQKPSLEPVLSTGTVQAPAVQQAVDLTMKRAIFLLPNRYFNDTEYFDIKEALVMTGVRTEIASLTIGDIRGMNRNVVTATILVRDIKVDDYDAFVFIGSQTQLPNEYLNNPDVVRLVRAANERKKILAAIDTAPGIFAYAGIVKGRNIASFISQRSILSQAGANWVSNPLEVDGNILTANGDNLAGRQLGTAILDSLRHPPE
jgi:SagB-type dehydrogenase family enzyme